MTYKLFNLLLVIFPLTLKCSKTLRMKEEQRTVLYSFCYTKNRLALPILE